MRFDPERVITLAEEFRGPRLSGTREELRARWIVSGLLSEAGWDVALGAPDRGWTPLGLAWRALVWLVCIAFFSSYFVLALHRHLAQVPETLCRLAQVVFVVSLVVFRKGTPGNSTVRSRLVVATRPRADSSKGRIVVVTRLTTRVADWTGQLVGILILIASVPCQFLLPTGNRILIEPGSWWVLLLLVMQVLALWTLARGIRPWPAAPTRGDNRTGLAFLGELARCWPMNAHERVEAWLVTKPKSRALDREFQRRISDGTPTIVIALDSIGVGPTLYLRGVGEAAEIARSAADSLWIPYTRGVRIFNGYSVPLVGLSGSHEDLPIDPEVLRRTAQLVVEIALRWGRSAEHSTAAQ